MPVHSLHIFDRKGRTLYSKRFVKDSNKNGEPLDEEFLAEQRKLVFGMLFSLREVAASLSPTTSNDNNNNKELHSVRTGAATLYNYESDSGLRFALYLANHKSPTTAAGPANAKNTSSSTKHSNHDSADVSTKLPDASIRAALDYIYNELWIQCVTRSPLYRPLSPNVEETNFEAKLSSFLRAQPWFR